MEQLNQDFSFTGPLISLMFKEPHKYRRVYVVFNCKLKNICKLRHVAEIFKMASEHFFS